MQRARNELVPRRRFLRLVGAVGAITGFSTFGDAQSGTGHHDLQGTSSGNDQNTILFGGEVSHWFGLAPDSIHGKENPTLQLKSGTKYELIWINIDGIEHRFQILDKGGKVLEESNDSEEEGETRRFTFTATDQMQRYRCKYHPQSMRGQIKIG